MKKKRLLLLASLPLAIAFTLGVLAMLPPNPGVTKNNFDRIQEGMTRAEVEAILGKPVLRFDNAFSTGTAIFRSNHWRGDDGAEASISFLSENLMEDKVTQKTWTPSKETVFDKLCRWLHLQ